MRIVPANTRASKRAAKYFHQALGEVMPSANVSLQKAQELYAHGLGYQDWHELAACLKQSTPPLYVENLPEAQQNMVLEEIWGRISKAMGFDHMHELVIEAAIEAGVGYGPKFASANRNCETPWGPVWESENIAPGITRVHTGSHGGYRLSPERQTRMHELLGESYEWYEEDCEAGLVEAAFPDVFDSKDAARRLRQWYPETMPVLVGETESEYDSRQWQEASQLFRAHPQKWFIVDHIGHIPEIDGFRFGYYAMTGRDALSWFEGQDRESAMRGSYFINPRWSHGRGAGSKLPTVGDMLPPDFEPVEPSTVSPKDAINIFGSGPRHSVEMFMQCRTQLFG